MSYRFEELHVWQKGIDLCEIVYEVTATFPADERYGLVSQLRRAAVSIPTNIAEGTGDLSDVEFARFLRYSVRSQHEVASLLRVAHRLEYLEKEDFDRTDRDLAEVGRMLHGLLRSIRSNHQVREDSSEDLTHDLEILLRRDPEDYTPANE